MPQVAASRAPYAKKKKKGKKKRKKWRKKTVSVDAKSKDHTGSITTNDMERKERRLSRVESSRVSGAELDLRDVNCVDS